MAAWLRAQTSYASTTPEMEWPAPCPETLAGDVLVAVVFTYNATIFAPSGWTLAYTNDYTTEVGNYSYAVFRKISTGTSEPATYLFQNDGFLNYAGIIVASFGGVSSSGELAGVSVALDTTPSDTTSATLTIPSVSASAPGRALAFYLLRTTGGVSFGAAGGLSPAGYTPAGGQTAESAGAVYALAGLDVTAGTVGSTSTDVAFDNSVSLVPYITGQIVVLAGSVNPAPAVFDAAIFDSVVFDTTEPVVGLVADASIALGAVGLTATATLTATGLNGAATITLGAATLASTARVAIRGTATPTLGAVTLTSAAVLPLKAAAAITLGAVTLASTARLAIRGTATPTLGAATLTATGSVAFTGIAGQAAITLGATTLSSAAVLPIKGAASVTLGAVALTSAAVLPIKGAASVTLGATTLASAAVLPLKATSAVTLGAVTLTSTAVLPLGPGGQASITLGAVTLTSTAVLPIKGTASITLGATTLTSAGVLPLKGTASVTLGTTTLTSAAVVPIKGTASATLGVTTLTSAARLAIKGAASVTLGGVGLVATGAPPLAGLVGQVTITLGQVTLFANNAVVIPMPRHVAQVPTVDGLRWLGPSLDLNFIAGQFQVWEEPTTPGLTGRTETARAGKAAQVATGRTVLTSGGRITRLSA